MIKVDDNFIYIMMYSLYKCIQNNVPCVCGMWIFFFFQKRSGGGKKKEIHLRERETFISQYIPTGNRASVDVLGECH